MQALVQLLLLNMRHHGYELAAIWNGQHYILACDGTSLDHYAPSAAPRQMLRPLTLTEALAILKPVLGEGTLHFTHQFERLWGSHEAHLCGPRLHTQVIDKPFLGVIRALQSLRHQFEQVTDYDAPFLVRVSGAGTSRILGAASLEQAHALRDMYLARFPAACGEVLMWQDTHYLVLP